MFGGTVTRNPPAMAGGRALRGGGGNYLNQRTIDADRLVAGGPGTHRRLPLSPMHPVCWFGSNDGGTPPPRVASSAAGYCIFAFPKGPRALTQRCPRGAGKERRVGPLDPPFCARAGPRPTGVVLGSNSSYDRDGGKDRISEVSFRGTSSGTATKAGTHVGAGRRFPIPWSNHGGAGVGGGTF